MTELSQRYSFAEQEEIRLAMQKPPEAFAYYAERFGNPPVLQQLHDDFWATDMLRRLDMIFTDRDYASMFFGTISPDVLASMTAFPPPQTEPFETLKRMRLLPTPEVWKASQKPSAEELFRAAQADIRAGGFAYVNPLHMELEYSRYVTNGSRMRIRKFDVDLEEVRRFTFDEFRRLPWLADKDTTLTEAVYSDAEKTAKQAASVFAYIMSKRNGNPLLVIGNKRYGSYFVVEPIEERLTREGIKVVHEYVTSFNYDREPEGWECGGGPSNEIIRWINDNGPDVIVVDGTKNIGRDDHVRFPAAFWGYINAFELYNSGRTAAWSGNAHRYKITLWSPVMEERVFIGSHFFNQNGGDYDREAVMACSTSPNSHAFFDNPDEYVHDNGIYGFAETGLVYRPLAGKWEDFVPRVQAEIKARIGKYL